MVRQLYAIHLNFSSTFKIFIKRKKKRGNFHTHQQLIRSRLNWGCICSVARKIKAFFIRFKVFKRNIPNILSRFYRKVTFQRFYNKETSCRWNIHYTENHGALNPFTWKVLTVRLTNKFLFFLLLYSLHQQ